MQQQAPQHIAKEKKRIQWDWWRENPREVILVIFILVFFFAVPWEGCGISQQILNSADLSVVP